MMVLEKEFLRYVDLELPNLLQNFSFLKGEYPSEWKKANVYSIYKKEDRQCKVNYRPIFLFSHLFPR
jgi:hypothetical protein